MSVRLGYRFAAIPEWVLYHPDLKGNDIRVFGVLARHAPNIKPSVQRIAALAQCSEQTVRNSRAALVKVGAIHVEEGFTDEGRQTTNIYHLAGDSPIKQPQEPTPTSPQEPTPEGEQQEAEVLLRSTTATAVSGRTRPQQDALFQAALHACGLNYDDLSKSERVTIGTAISDLPLSAKPEDFPARVRNYRKHFGKDVALTPHALCKWWGQTAKPPKREDDQEAAQAARRAAAR